MTTKRGELAPDGGPGQTELDALARRLHAPLLRYFQRRLGAGSEAEDFTQEVFYRLARRPVAMAADYLDGYVFEVAANLLKDNARRARVRHAHGHEPIDDAYLPCAAPGPDKIIQDRQRLNVLKDALAELPSRTRLIFLLHRYDGLPHAEISSRIGISVSAVEKHMISALVHLRRRMTEVDQE
jgi:RNA polymerase sigma-70 factor (ECF subfamily)